MECYHVSFVVTDFSSVAEVTELMGMEPTRAWAKGDPMPRRGRPPFPRPFSKWIIAASPEPIVDFADQIEALLQLLEPRAASVGKVMERYPCVISVITDYEWFNPGFQLSVGHMSRIAALGLPMDFDLYFLPKDEAEDSDVAEPGVAADTGPE
jgi:hypothetical protein